jgi:ATP-binding protein involved in chromosome partitioning
MAIPVQPSQGHGLAAVSAAVAIASGKGGVGKTTVSVNLACALARLGRRVGLLDADITGPNVPWMMGLVELPAVREGWLVPAERFGVKTISMGLIAPKEEAIIWRGPMLHGAIQKFLKDVQWGELDILVVDLPPGTSDVPLSLTQAIPVSGVVMVSTPQDVALLDVRKAVAMFEKLKVPILGLVENMAGFVCPHCGKSTDLFSSGGGKRAAKEWGIPFLGEIPLAMEVRIGGDSGEPVVLSQPDSSAAQAFMRLASEIAQMELSRPKTVWKV